jgi:hypothetical protein
VRVIGLTGRARAGKDTVASIIADELGDLHVIREGFADKLKISAARALGIAGTPEDCIAACDALKVDGQVEVELGMFGPVDTITGRRFLQLYGTEAHRDVFGEDFWLDAVLPTRLVTGDLFGSPALALDRFDADVLVVSDVRFPNEAERVLDVGGEVWEVLRPGGPLVEGHSSEEPIPAGLVTRSIVNDDHLDHLAHLVRDALGSFVA